MAEGVASDPVGEGPVTFSMLQALSAAVSTSGHSPPVQSERWLHEVVVRIRDTGDHMLFVAKRLD